MELWRSLKILRFFSHFSVGAARPREKLVIWSLDLPQSTPAGAMELKFASVLEFRRVLISQKAPWPQPLLEIYNGKGRSISFSVYFDDFSFICVEWPLNSLARWVGLILSGFELKNPWKSGPGSSGWIAIFMDLSIFRRHFAFLTLWNQAKNITFRDCVHGSGAWLSQMLDFLSVYCATQPRMNEGQISRGIGKF